jgi:hypothetical protein
MPVMGGKTIGVGQEEGNAQFANMCFSLADAMIEARKPKEEAGLPAIRRRVKKGE